MSKATSKRYLAERGHTEKVEGIILLNLDQAFMQDFKCGSERVARGKSNSIVKTRDGSERFSEGMDGPARNKA